MYCSQKGSSSAAHKLSHFYEVQGVQCEGDHRGSIARQLLWCHQS